MKYTTTFFLLTIVFFGACKKSPRSYTSKMAGPHYWHGTESGTKFEYTSHAVTSFTTPISRIDTISVYSDDFIQMDGKDFELVDANSSGKFLLFKDERWGTSNITFYYSTNTFKYVENTGSSRIELVSP